MRTPSLFILAIAATSCVPRLAQIMRPTLTPSQMSALQSDSTLTIVNTSYYPFRKQRIYSTGSVQVQKLANGQVIYKRIGLWKQFYASGVLFYVNDYTTGRASQYNPDGTLNHDIYNVKDEYSGDSLQVNKAVRFVNGDRQDTMYVQHWYYQNGKLVKEVFTKDFRGKQVIKR